MRMFLLLAGLLVLAGSARAHEMTCTSLDPQWAHFRDSCLSVWCPAPSPAAGNAVATCQTDGGGIITVDCGSCRSLPTACATLEPTCARWVRRYTRAGALRSETCRRWATITSHAPDGH